jgi:putative pyruvate formate lyase activating enzyme
MEVPRFKEVVVQVLGVTEICFNPEKVEEIKY